MPVPEPSEVVKFVIVGLGVNAQQTPLAVTGELPSEVTLPPNVAVVCATFVTEVVKTVGATGVGNVVNEISFP